MPFGQSIQDLWANILAFFKFVARIPLAVLVVFFAGTVAFILLMLLYRSAQWFWTHVVSFPW